MNSPIRSPRERDRLVDHLARIRRLPPLTRAEEHIVAVRARRGDSAAKQKLVSHNLWLTVVIARKQARGALRLEDLIQEGSVGLVRAVDSFDPHAGTRFSTYAVWWIRAYIAKYLQRARSSVRPRSGTVAQHDASLDTAIPDEDGPHLERIADDRATPEEVCSGAERDRDVRIAICRIRRDVGERGWDIIQNRLGQDTPETLEQIGRRWGVSRVRVRQVELKTRDVLRRSLQPIHEGEAA